MVSEEGRTLLMTPSKVPARTTRRAFLVRGSAAVAGALLPRFGQGAGSRSSKSLAFVNLHTGEDLDVTYWAAGSYDGPAIENINHLFRDYRTGEATPIHLGLLDLLHDIRSELSTGEAFELISGYRSPKTNARLRALGHGVAKKSLHIVGKAADIRIAGVSLPDLRDVGRRLARGGVGYYEKQFVHVDVGRVRYW